MHSALVTGGAGFIGSHMVGKLLSLGYEVIGLDCFTDYYSRDIKEKNVESSLTNKNYTFIEADILDMETFPEVDYVFHLAAQAGVRASWGKRFDMYTRNNIQVTQKLLEFYKDSSIKKLVYASSSSVYGDAKLPMSESSLLKPVSPYGVTKLAGEHLSYLYWRNYTIPTIALRYFTVYGPRQRPDMAIYNFVKAIFKGERLSVFGDGTQTRDFTYIDDVIEGTLLAADSNIVGEVINIGGGSRISINKVLKLIENNTKKEAKVTYLERQRGDVRDTWADVSKAEAMLHWRPRVDISNGLKRFVEWYINLSDTMR